MQKQKKALLKFLGTFLGVIIFYYVLLSITEGAFLTSYINFTAYISASLLSIFAPGAHSEFGSIVTPKFTLVLSIGCEGSEPIIIFLAGVLAFPSTLRNKLNGLTIGLPTLYILNIIRVFALYFVGISLTSSFDLFHSIIFPVLFILLSVIAWLFWIKTLGQKQIGAK